MDATRFAEIAIVAIFAVICIVAFLIYRGRAKVWLKGPLKTSLNLDASNNAPEPAEGARIESSRSRTGGAAAEDYTGKGASIKRTKVERDLKAVARNPEKTNDAKTSRPQRGAP
jgi:hypothetical protein